MLASVLIIAISAALFVYWFRYTCILILSTKTSKDYSSQVATANQLQFVNVQGALRTGGGLSLDQLERALDRDFTLVSRLLLDSAHLQFGSQSIGPDSLEQHMLRLDFHVMRLWYRLTRPISESSARSALHEMSMVVGHFANAFGERSEQGAAA